EEIPAQPSDIPPSPAEPETVVPSNPEKSEETALVPQSPASSELSSGPLPPVIYGKEHLSQLLDTLLPHRKAFNQSQS
ncbi:MAG: carbon dioxide concentrating mechanism protein, partial [Planktothrix sp.]